MIEPEAQRSEGASATRPPVFRLVLSFKESSEEARPRPDPSDEAYHAENLFIAAESSYAALSRFEGRWREAAYGERPPSGQEEWQVLVDAYHLWLDGAEPLLERLWKLRDLGYDSDSIGRLEAQVQAAREVLADDRDRRSIERKAPRGDRLAAIAAGLKPGPLDYD